MTSKIEVPRELLELITRSYPRNITDHVTIRTIQTQQAVAMDELRVLLAAPTACRECMGTGGIGRLETCSECKGTGKIAAPEAPRQGDELDASAERNAMQRQRDSALSELKRECDNTDAALRLLGFDPHVFRTDGGSLNLSKLRSSVAPLSPGHSGGGAGVVANDELQAIQDRHEAWKAGEAHGIESAARLIEKRMEDYINEHGSFDPETGAVEFPGSGEEYVGELVEISEAIRTLDKVKELNQ